MKSVLLCAVLVLLLCFSVIAEEGTTSGATYTPSQNGLAAYSQHSHKIDIPEKDDAAGVGADIVVYQDDNPDAKLEEVVIEEKYDFANGDNSVYAVVRWNVFKFFKKEE